MYYGSQRIPAYGQNSRLGLRTAHALKETPRGKVQIQLFLHNQVTTSRFKLPKLSFQLRSPIKFSDDRITNENVQPNLVKHTVSIKQTDGSFNLQTLGVLNSYDRPSVTNGQINFYPSTYSCTSFPIVANATHIVGIDVDDSRFFIPWQLKSSNDCSYFQMPIKVRRDFNLSIYVCEVSSDNYLDALDHWYDLFPEIYKTQPNGAGAWLPNPDLNILFENSTEEVDLYLGNFLWGCGPPKKISVPNYIYSETTIYRIPIEYSSDPDQMEANLRNCVPTFSYDNIEEECQIALDHAIRNKNGKRSISSSGDYFGSNGGILYTNTWDHELYQRRMVADVWRGFFNPNNWFVGIGLDSFSHYEADYEFDDHIPAEDISPFTLIEGETIPMQSIMSGFFHLFSNKSELIPRGIAFNSNYLAPQLAKFVASVGWEIGLSNYGQDINYVYRQNFWSLRYAIGSRAMSMLENQAYGTLPKYAEDTFSIMFSVGITPSSQPINCRGFLEDPEQLADMRPFYVRWAPTIRKVLNHTVFKANNCGVVYSIPTEGNTPEVSDNMNTDLQTLSTFCNEQTGVCWTNVFIGYGSKNEEMKTLKRTVELRFPIRPKCIFEALETTCEVHDDYNVTVTTTWNHADRHYRLVTVEMDPDMLSNGTIAGIAVICVVVVIVVVALIIILVKRRSKKTSD
ncbi:hypothetical protein GPJ56_000119 [Histomonas meleagridis]|uniref:uncharacterized protein n=1 Tax=Histomonas meleagridis TaxID=135588 RepID=UPI003559ABCB|nr:hypothetical protein GPJ56_000119 [Histomonas meleagridis]KAH0805618.1 hypothetical protein GO595_001673 [Histomonas meleagridis]